MKSVALLACLLALHAARAEVSEEVVSLPSAGEAKLPVLFSRDDAQPPFATAVLFNGGGGAVGLLTRIPRPGANFLVRSRSRFVSEGVATAVIDAPTDLGSMGDGYRMSRRHAEDVARVLAELQQRFPGKPVFLVGTSRGTVSAAYAGAALGDRVAGVVLTSTVFNRGQGGNGVMGFDWSGLKHLLFVHHVDDACVVTPYGMAHHLSGPTRPLVSVHGGDVPRSEPCEAFSAHGYLGVEGPAVHAIVQWMRGETPPADVP